MQISRRILEQNLFSLAQWKERKMHHNFRIDRFSISRDDHDQILGRRRKFTIFSNSKKLEKNSFLNKYYEVLKTFWCGYRFEYGEFFGISCGFFFRRASIQIGR